MNRFGFRPAADKDLESITDHIAEGDPFSSVTLGQERPEKCRLPAEMLASTPARLDLGRDIRRRPAGKRAIYFELWQRQSQRRRAVSLPSVR